MELLKQILGDELYAQVKTAIDAHNGDEANVNSQMKLANLAKGEYVAKGKYDSLQTSMAGKDAELTEANQLIAQLKKDVEGNQALGQQIADYELKVKQLQNEIADTKLKSAVKVALLGAKAQDVDYLTFKLTEKLNEAGEHLELDDNDAIKGWDTQLEGLKTQFPTMFESKGNDDGYKPLGGEGLPNGKNNKALTRKELMSKSYQERNEIYQNDPDGYQAAMNAKE